MLHIPREVTALDYESLVLEREREAQESDRNSSDEELDADVHESSDEEDVFRITAAVKETLSKEYLSSPQERWRLAVLEMKELCRNDCTIPLDPFDTSGTKVYERLTQVVRLPRWHCPFHGCIACDAGENNARTMRSYEKEWWSHIWSAHKSAVMRVMKEQLLKLSDTDLEEIAFALVIAGMLERERTLIPRCGIAVDRRLLDHVGEVFREDSLKTLM